MRFFFSIEGRSIHNECSYQVGRVKERMAGETEWDRSVKEEPAASESSVAIDRALCVVL